MSSSLSRRSLMKHVAAGSVAAVAPDLSVAAENTWKRGPGMPSEGPNTPKIGAPENGRAGAGLTAFDYDRMKDLAPLPAEGRYTVDQLWENIGYFLKAVIPVAEKSNVRLALHPNDPPVALSRGSGQIMATVEGWKK